MEQRNQSDDEWPLTKDEELVRSYSTQVLNIYETKFGTKYGSLTKSKRNMLYLATDMVISLSEELGVRNDMLLKISKIFSDDLDDMKEQS